MIALAAAAFGVALSNPVSDGDRWIAIQRDAATIEVRDEAKGVKRLLTTPCFPVSVSHAGVLLTACPHPPMSESDPYQVTDLRTNVVTPIDVQQVVYSGTTFAVAAGREWIAIHGIGNHEEFVEYRNRATGEVRDSMKAEGPRLWADVDSPALSRPLCRPVRRRLEYSSLAASAWERVQTDGRAVAFRLAAYYCGHVRPLSLGKDARNMTVGAGWLTWTRPSGAYAERERDRLRFVVRGSADAAVHTRRAVYVRRGGQLSRARLPRPAS